MSKDPPYPENPCGNCGGDYWLRPAWWGPAEWVCNTCHPEPKGDDDEARRILYKQAAR